jgi:hypothetical protein
MRLWRAVQDYAASDDPLVSASNFIALTVASNQPFYPLYVYWAVGEGVTPTFYTFLSTPFFLAVPALARRNSQAGRSLLSLAGMANTALCAKLFGVASGVELFLAPCVVIAMLQFRRAERLASFGLAGVAFILFAFVHDRYGAPAFPYSTDAYASFQKLNAFSVGSLCVFVGLVFANAREPTQPVRA